MPTNREKSPNELAFHDGPSDWDVLFEGDGSNSGVIGAFESSDTAAHQSDPEADKAKQKEQRENEERMEEVEHQLTRRLAELDDLSEQKKRFFGQVEEAIEDMRRGRADSTDAVMTISRAEHLLEDIDSAIHSASRACEEYGDTAHDIGDKENPRIYSESTKRRFGV